MNGSLRRLIADGGDGIERVYRLPPSEAAAARRGEVFVIPATPTGFAITPDGGFSEVYGDDAA